MAALAAAAVLAVGVLVVWRPAPERTLAAPRPATALTMDAAAPTPYTATVTLTSQDWGTDIDMTCTYHETPGEPAAHDDAGDRLAMVAVGRDGRHEDLATWTARDGATATPSASTSLPLSEIAAVQVVFADTREVLLYRNW